MPIPSLRRNYQKLKTRLTGSSQPYQGYIDGLKGDQLYGWAVETGSPDPVRIGLFTRDGLLDVAIAGISRMDVRDAGIGTGLCGFSIPITDGVSRAVAAGGGEVFARVMDSSDYEIDRFDFPPEFFIRNGQELVVEKTAATPLPDPMLEKCRVRLFIDLACLGELLDHVEEAPEGKDIAVPPAQPLHEHLFSTGIFPGSEPDIKAAIPKLPAYIEYTKFRLRADQKFDTENDPDDYDHCLNWYLNHYGVARNGLRIPLSAEVISYLNQPMVIGGQPYTLSRAMQWQIAKHPARRQTMQPENYGWYLDTLYWWAFEESHALNSEDCLVPQAAVDTLRTISLERWKDPWPLNHFIDRFHRDNVAFHFLDGSRERDRELLALSLLVMAAKRPDILRYIPARTLSAAFARPEDGSPSPFETFIGALTQSDAPPEIPLERYSAAMRLKGYDLPSQSFLSVTMEGNRYHAAALPAISGDEIVDVQMIGPFEKASGLGQATRLSAEAMACTGLVTNAVDFGLDNPAPEGFSNVGELSEYKKARINLIHLNAEGIPNVFAYAPDVFNGAYNIGYFFWELDSPAACHYLALELLDEVWVSSQYGVDIYKPATDKPVTRVGMCFEDLPVPDAGEARSFVNNRFRLKGDEFVFLVTFDSYSFVQRKNPVGVLKAFQKAFAGVKGVRLIVKTQNRDNVSDPAQARIWKQVESLMAQDRRIQVMNETLSYENLLRLKKGADCYISLHRSEGWGFGMIEAMNLQVPVICTGYSGNMEFCSDETAWLVGYEEVLLEPDDYIFVTKGQKWAEPDAEDATRQMRAVYDDPDERAKKVAAAYQNVQRNFSSGAIGKRYEARLREILATLEDRLEQRALKEPDTKADGALNHYYCEFDAEALLDSFHVHGQRPEAGILKNFLGTRIGAYVLPSLLEPLMGQVEPRPAPDNWHADIAEWAAALRSVDLACGTYRIVELGCGWGCWITNMGVAARARGLDLDLIGIEGDLYHLESARKTLELNGFCEQEFTLHHGVAGPETGKAAFPVHAPDGANWGAEPVFYPSKKQLAEFQADPAWAILDCMPLDQLSQGQVIDLLHIDIQGAEFDYVTGNFPGMEKYVKRVLIGTHSRGIEGQLSAFFQTHGWRLEMDRPAISEIIGGKPEIRIDGVQMWANPKLIKEGAQ